MANLTGIICARDAADIPLSTLTKHVIYLTSETHFCIEKNLKIAGLRYCLIRLILTDSDCHMKIEVLRKTIIDDEKLGLIPFLVIGTAGTTNAGAIDDLDAMADICQHHNIWFHVDAALGVFIN